MKRTCYMCIKKYISKCDMFGQPLRIYLDKRHKYKSIFGGILSLIIFIILFVIALDKFIKLFNKSSLKIIQTEEYFSNPGQLDLTKKGFTFAFGFPNSLISNYGKDLFEIKLFTHSYQRNKGNFDKEIKIVNCTEEHFKSTKEQFKLIFVINNDIKLNSESPIHKYIKSDIHFLINPSTNLYKTADIFISEIEILDNYNPFNLFSKPKIIKNYIYKDEKREQTNLFSEEISEIATFYFRKSYTKYKYEKNYGDILTILSYLGGLSGALVLIFGYFACTYNDYSYLLKISNYLYSFPTDKQFIPEETDPDPNPDNITSIKNIELKIPPEQSPETVYKSQILNKKKTLKKIKTKEFSEFFKTNEETKQDITQTLTQRTIDYLLQKVTLYLDSIKPLKPKFFKDFFSLLPFGEHNKKHRELVKLAKSSAKESLNLGTILLKLQEIDRLKQIVLSEEQKKVFGFFPKQNIYCKKNLNTNKKFSVSMETGTFVRKNSLIAMDNYCKFVEMFNFVQELKNSNEIDLFKKEINRNLINILYNEIRDLIKNSLKETDLDVAAKIKTGFLQNDRKVSIFFNEFADSLNEVRAMKKEKTTIFETEEDENKGFEENI